MGTGWLNPSTSTWTHTQQHSSRKQKPLLFAAAVVAPPYPLPALSFCERNPSLTKHAGNGGEKRASQEGENAPSPSPYLGLGP